MALTWVGPPGARTQAVINSPGVYRIEEPINVVSGAVDAIFVAPNSGYPIVIEDASRKTCSHGPGSTAAAISATYNDGIRIIGIGGTSDGFGFGARIDGSHGAIARNLEVLKAWWCGITGDGHDQEIRDCRVDDVGGTTFAADVRCFGFRLGGSNFKIIGNTCGDVRATGDEEAVLFGTSEGYGVLKDNIGQFAVIRPRQFGVWGGGNTAADRCETIGNHIRNAFRGIEIGYGIVDHNTLKGCATPIVSYPHTEIGAFNPIFP